MANFGAGWTTETERASAKEGGIGVFGAYAKDYDLHRPTYPAKVFDDLVQKASAGGRPITTALDLGCGTGRGALELALRVPKVFAVDPDMGMLNALSDVLATSGKDVQSKVVVQRGSAEATGLPPASIDAACLLQCWHWVDGSKGLPELKRIMRPGGVVAVVWNDRDLQDPVVKVLESLMEQYNKTYHREDRQCEPWAKSLYGNDEIPVEAVQHYSNTRQVKDAQALVDLAMTFSYVRNALSAEQQKAFCSQLRQEVAAVVGGSDKAFPLPFTTKAYFLRRKPDAGGQ